MKKFTRSQIMKAAWEIARRAANKFGGKAKQYISEALKMVWVRVKSTVMVPSWFIAKKTGGIRPVEKTVKGFVEKETEKAVLVKVPAIGDNLWVPKSVLV